QKTDAHMLSKTLLLSPQAEIDSKPELEIYADDVKCGHGATAGEIDDDALFYLRARGIGEAEARNILIEAFLMDIAEEVSFAPVRDRLGGLVAGWLGAHQGTGGGDDDRG
ncbi:MAG: SufD family Fe-S cluster assembly protein, partial [Geminicoccales bacterium]